MSTGSAPRPRCWRCLLGLALLLMAVGAVTIVMSHGDPIGRIVADIEDAGGRINTSRSFNMRLLQAVLGRENAARYVVLTGPNFDDQWLVEHHDLQTLRLRSLTVLKTGLSHDALHGLLETHELDTFVAPGSEFGDAEAELLGRRTPLTVLCVCQTALTDDGFARLNPARIPMLDISGTRVTPTAIIEHLAGSQLRFIGLDGDQFTPEVAEFLKTQSELASITLMGPAVGDEHLRRLHGLSSIQAVNLDQTSATPAATEALQAAHPAWQIRVFAPPSPYYTWRSDLPATSTDRDPQPDAE